MWIELLQCKIHRVTATDANLEYEGSITVGTDLMEAAGLREFQKVDVYNITNGERFSTYVLKGAPGTICINGAAAWKAVKGDRLIIAAYCLLTDEEVRTFQPDLVYVNNENRITRVVKGSRVTSSNERRP